MANLPSSNLTPTTAAKSAAKFTASSIGQGVVWQAAVKAVPYMTGASAAAWAYLSNELTQVKAVLLRLVVMLALSFGFLAVAVGVDYFRRRRSPELRVSTESSGQTEVE